MTSPLLYPLIEFNRESCRDILKLSGEIKVAYIIWSIPGYYRWKKTKKGIEQALFVTKLSIGILTFVGIIFGYASGKF